LSETAEPVRSEDAAGNSKAEHEGVLRGSNVKQTEIFETETIVLGWRLILIGVLKEAVPNSERVLLEFPALLFGEIGDWSVEPKRLGFGGPIGEARRGIVGDKSVSSMTDERSEAALADTSEEAAQIFLLLTCELCRIDNSIRVHAEVPS
jgi:hypothetical protein